MSSAPVLTLTCLVHIELRGVDKGTEIAAPKPLYMSLESLFFSDPMRGEENQGQRLCCDEAMSLQGQFGGKME